MEHRYFKLVTLYEEKPDWLLSRLQSGFVHFGWGFDDCNLNVLKEISRSDMTPQQMLAWRQTRFLIRRIRKGDRLVIQYETPLRHFMIAEVKVDQPYSFLDPPHYDFNHRLAASQLTPQLIDVNSKMVPLALKHDLSKRGHYYQIYPPESIRALEHLVSEKLWLRKDQEQERTENTTMDRLRAEVRKNTINEIQTRWKAKDFETFCEKLIKRVPGVEVHNVGDTLKGWDLTVRLRDPFTSEVLFEDVPVQCKNMYGKVEDDRPIEDLVRCVENNERASIAYLFILGELDEKYREKVDLRAEEMGIKLGRDIQFRVVDQDMIAELYISHLHDDDPSD